MSIDHIQRREDHWAIVDLVGKGGHIRTVPMPDWVKQTIDNWLSWRESHTVGFFDVFAAGAWFGERRSRRK